LGHRGPGREGRAHPHRARSVVVQGRAGQLEDISGDHGVQDIRAVARTGKWGDGISQNVVWYVVKSCCEKAGLQHIAPHDLRRTCAKLCHTNGGEIEQIQFLLGHASVQTTERYLGCKQNLGHPVNDLFHLEVMAAASAITGSAVIEKPDRIVYEYGVGGDQEGADKRTSARNAGYGNSSV
jgi:hypothetical protein